MEASNAETNVGIGMHPQFESSFESSNETTTFNSSHIRLHLNVSKGLTWFGTNKSLNQYEKLNSVTRPTMLLWRLCVTCFPHGDYEKDMLKRVLSPDISSPLNHTDWRYRMIYHKRLSCDSLAPLSPLGRGEDQQVKRSYFLLLRLQLRPFEDAGGTLPKASTEIASSPR